jgi:tetratricopeptide (TPR) repeat protein
VRPAPKTAVEESGPVTEELNEASFFLEQGLVEEAREVLDTVELVRPGLPRTAALRDRLAALEAGKAAPRSTPTPAPAPHAVPAAMEPIPVSTGSYNLAEELADEIQELGAPPEEPAPAGGDFQYSVEEVFSEFKKGLERVVPSNDVDTHYDLGIAYKEMGLYDPAIAEFKQLTQDPKREVFALTMIGECCEAKGLLTDAIIRYKEALNCPQITPEETIQLYFCLGSTFERLSDRSEALYFYEKVAKRDPKFRDVDGKIAALKPRSARQA